TDGGLGHDLLQVGLVRDVRPLDGDARPGGELAVGLLLQCRELRGRLAAAQQADVGAVVGFALEQSHVACGRLGDRVQQLFLARAGRAPGRHQHRGDGQRRHAPARTSRAPHFTAPIVMPSAKCLRTRKAITNIGAITSSPAAAICPHATPSGSTSVMSATGRVSASERDRKVGNRNSFQASRNENTAATKMPGAASGVITRHSRATCPHPSIRAASSISVGSPSTNPLSNQVIYGTTIDRLTITSARWVSMRPRLRKSVRNGRAIATPGMNCVATIASNIARWPGNRYREKP